MSKKARTVQEKRNEMMDELAQGISHCCRASLDEREVLRSGRFKGHGPRYCSKCGKLAYMV